MARPPGFEPGTLGLEGEISEAEGARCQSVTAGAMPKCHAERSVRQGTPAEDT
jgi:hypothetical protein